MTSLLSLHSVRKTYSAEMNRVQAVNDISIDVEEGEVFTLLGPSGCGKSTTLRCIAGLEIPDEGEIILDGECMYSRSRGQIVPVNRRDIGMVFQSYAIWPHLSVFDNVAYPLRYGSKTHLSKKEIQAKVLDALALVRLNGLENRPAPQLSGGQQQRVALARALVKGPKLLLLDEPLSNLDAKLREEMRIELRELIHRLGLTAVYVTHDQVEALVLSDRIGVMQNGRLVQVGASWEIYKRPQNTFVASFIGTANLLSGRFKSDSAIEMSGVAETGIGSILCTTGKDIVDGQDVRVAVHPENIAVAESIDRKTVGADGAVNVFEGDIEACEFQGNTTLLRVRVGNELISVITLSTQKMDAGKHIYLVMRPEYCLAVPLKLENAQANDRIP